jgi:DNA-binding SARP family transcriptional activator
VDFRILGPLEVHTDAGERTSFGPRHTRVLAALLLAADRVVAVEDLIDAVWDEAPPATARRQIQNCVWALRKHLPVIGDSAGYRLRVADGQLDLHRFQRLVTQARAASGRGDRAEALELLSGGLRLWRGPALAGCGGRAIRAGAARLNELRLSAIEQRLDLRLGPGSPDDGVVGELTELVAAHPLRERLVGQLMLALHLDGRQADALAAYQQVRLRLADELGIEPGPALQDLHTAILRNAVNVPLTEVAPAVAREPADRRMPAAGRLDPLADITAELADVVEAQWRAEAATRSLHQPAPIPMSWTRVSDGVSARPSAILSSRAGPPTMRTLPATGVIDDIAETVLALPNRQLVVLGPPGSGKSALAIIVTLDLLARRATTGLVPVLLTLSSWDPRAEHLDSWLTRRLIEEYPALAATTARGDPVAAALVTRGRLIPILDGLDEMPAELHAPAVAALSDAVGYGRPVLVTCRGEEFERAVAANGVVLAHAMVMSIGPVAAGAAIAYLTDAGPAGDLRWAPVFAHLRALPHSALAAALSTPLMLWLARTVYLPGRTDPAELLDPAHFATRRAVEKHLLAALVPTVYAARPPAPGLTPSRRARRSPRRPYPSRKAAAWLTYLAGQLHRRGTQDLAWWQVHTMVPRAALTALAAASVAGLGLLIFLLYLAIPPLRSGLPVVAAAAITTVPVLAIVMGLAPPTPWPIQLAGLRSTRRRWSRLGTGAAAGSFTAVISAPVGSVRLSLGLLLVGLAGGGFINAIGRCDLLRARRPDEIHRDDRATLVTLVVGAGLVGGAGGLLLGGLTARSPVWLLNAIAGALAFGAAGYLLSRPGYRARAAPADRETGATALAGPAIGAVLGTAVGAGIGLAGHGQHPDLAVVVAGAVLGGVGLGWLAGLAITASGWFLLARVYLAVRVRLPWRLLDFLHDAQQRGVLRQTGGLWQFRHGQLQEHLAISSTD